MALLPARKRLRETASRAGSAALPRKEKTTMTNLFRAQTKNAQGDLCCQEGTKVVDRYRTRTRWRSRGVGPAWGCLLLALAVGAPARAADLTYKIQPIFKIGDRVAGINTKPTANGISLEGLNDRGQIDFAISPADNPNGGALLQYADGQVTPIAVAAGEGPLGVWPKDLVGYAPSSMNQAGNVVFTALSWHGGNSIDLGMFLWDAQTGKAAPIVVKGMPATGNRTFEGLWWSPAINNHNEIAFPGRGHDTSHHSWVGIFLRGVDGMLQPIALTGQKMPDGRKLDEVWFPSLDDAGRVAFVGGPADAPGDSAYLWENGTLTPVAVPGMAAPEGGKIGDVWVARVNNQNRSVLVLASRSTGGRLGLYRFTDGKLTALVVPGQALPDGGKLSDIVLGNYGVSPANELGQHAFMAKLGDGSTAAYLLDPDGKLSPILKSGQVTALGKITLIGVSTRPSGGIIRGGFGIGLNRQGQVALNVSIDGGPTTLVLLTPAAP
jgi:hypothetical protein